MMSSDNVNTSQETFVRHLDELQNLLDRQIKYVRKGNYTASEATAEKTGKLIDKLNQFDVSAFTEIRERFARLVISYQTVILGTAGEKERIEKQLRQIGQVRKTLRTYSS